MKFLKPYCNLDDADEVLKVVREDMILMKFRKSYWKIADLMKFYKS